MVDQYVERLRELNVSYPENIVEKSILSYAVYFGLGYTEALDKFLGEAEAFDVVIRNNHDRIIESGLGRKIIEEAVAKGYGDVFSERQLVVLDGYTYDTSEEAKSGLKPYNPLAVGIRRVLEDVVEHGDRIFYSKTIGAPNKLGQLCLSTDVSVEDYDVVKDCALAIRGLVDTGKVLWTMHHGAEVGIPANLMSPQRPFSREKPEQRQELDYTSVKN